jgi:Outer membrane efflux protein
LLVPGPTFKASLGHRQARQQLSPFFCVDGALMRQGRLETAPRFLKCGGLESALAGHRQVTDQSPAVGKRTCLDKMVSDLPGALLKHRRRAAIEAYNQALAEYRYTVLVAFQNVADSLHAIESDADALKADAIAERSASESFTLARDQYQAGYIPYLSLLVAENSYQQTIISLVQAEASRYADTAALFQALGDGWWKRSDVVASDVARQDSRSLIP